MTDFYPTPAQVEQVEAKVLDLVSNDIPVDELVNHLTVTDRDVLAKEGLKILVQRCIGEKIAAKVWDSDLGIDATRDEVRNFWRSLNIPDEDGDECYSAFMEHMSDVTVDTIRDYETLSKFAPLFEGEPEGMNLGEIASLKAAVGNKLALSFLAWKEVA